VDRAQVEQLLASVADGSLTASAAAERLQVLPFTDLGFARVDTHRAVRTGDPEVVYGAGKTPEQTVAIVDALLAAGGERPALVTRAPEPTIAALREAYPDVEVDSGTVLVGPVPKPRGNVAVVTAGTSDARVGAEATLTLRAFGAGVTPIRDVGVAGLHRLLDKRADLEAADCVIVIAGMEGALPSVIGGLVGTPVIAVPTSVGYGASFGGLAALLGMLNSCAPGVVVCNIDNGFGAGVFAARVARLCRERQ
jgi:NCAIR mutase (PurE)-related protein